MNDDAVCRAAPGFAGSANYQDMHPFWFLFNAQSIQINVKNYFRGTFLWIIFKVPQPAPKETQCWVINSDYILWIHSCLLIIVFAPVINGPSDADYCVQKERYLQMLHCLV